MGLIKKDKNCLIYEGCNFLKQRLILSILSGKSIKITNIRHNHLQPGLHEYEIGLIRLLDKITNGTKIDLNQSGTELAFTPGVLQGGFIKHDCCLDKGIGYYLDVLVALGPFCKTPITCTLKGITNSQDSPSVDKIKNVSLSILNKFMVTVEDFEIKLIKRGFHPKGTGEVLFKCPTRKMRTVQVLDSGIVKRIRGVAYNCCSSPAIINRTIERAKHVMLNFLPDVYIQSDKSSDSLSNKSPAFGIMLFAETTNTIVYSTESICDSKTQLKESATPDELGHETALKLLNEIYRGGCVDSSYQWMVALFMALGQKNVHKYSVGPLSQYTIHFLQHLYDFFGIKFKLENPENDEDTQISKNVILTCVGLGYLKNNKVI